MGFWLRPEFYVLSGMVRGALSYALGGALIFAVAGLVEGCLLGAVIVCILMPLDDKTAPLLAANILINGAVAGFLSGFSGFAIAGIIQAVRAAVRPSQFRYQPPDAPFWNCVRSALWASAMLGLGGAFTGAVSGELWAVLTLSDAVASRFACEMLSLAIGSEIGAIIGFFTGVLLGALAPHSVQTTRQRIKAYRHAAFASWQARRTESLR